MLIEVSMVEREHTPECFRGWQEFPKNLSLSLLHVDSNRCSVRLSQDSERLFVSDKDSRLWALIIDNAGVTKGRSSVYLPYFMTMTGPVQV